MFAILTGSPQLRYPVGHGINRVQIQTEALPNPGPAGALPVPLQEGSEGDDYAKKASAGERVGANCIPAPNISFV
jgi:hypothetical protein